MKSKIKNVAILTSGGDAPGMNAAIRAIVREGINKNLNLIAIHNGYEGMIEGNFKEINSLTVGNIIQRGGTIIKTSRSEKFTENKYRKLAYSALKKEEIAAVILIGGNGSFAGADAFTTEFNIPFIGVPKTIDNDVYGTDYSIGFDTATNTALEAIDKLRDTADSHHRLFFVEVMGRDLGFIALHCGIAAGAEAILIPESKTNLEDLLNKLKSGWKRKKSSLIVVLAEGAVKGGALEIAQKVKKQFDHYEIRISTLGHIQRGGNPSCFDRMLASRLGYEAMNALMTGKKNIMVGLVNNKIIYTSFLKASSGKHQINRELLEMADRLTL